MEGYAYPYSAQFSQMLPINGEYANQGDGFGFELKKDREQQRPSRLKHRTHKTRNTKRSHSRSSPGSSSRSRTQSRTRSLSRSTASRQRNLSLKEPGFLDAFRVLYLTPSKHKKGTTKFLATKKRQDQIQEILKGDRLGSKRWFLYPRAQTNSEPVTTVAVSRDASDQRFKVDADFFRKYKRSTKVDSDAPIMKLKKWELIFYKKLGFIEAV